MASNSYPAGFYFMLSLKGEDAAFQEVSGISKELGIEEVISGGENQFKYRLPTTSSGQNLVLKRALVPEGSSLVDWCIACIDGGLNGAIQTNDISVSLLNANAEVLVMWAFHKAYPIKYAVSDLKSQENAIVIESIELAYTYSEIIESSSNISNLFD
ncbi:phage tail protein [Pedobacter miscanthi]|jgi:phage tail-like protein|uniref:phage tail protein n=1 Tax=Pedobacter miscanthi TaxID=2259170 RepID=UPI00292FE981|nr:phage tail protein [Pedobacter miscanthi]